MHVFLNFSEPGGGGGNFGISRVSAKRFLVVHGVEFPGSERGVL